jgi:hypothetical protein
MKKEPKEKKVPKLKKEKKEKIENKLNGLEQSFKNPAGTLIILKDILTETDWWILTKGKQQLTMVTHDGVKKIATEAGILSDVQWTHITVGTNDNQMTNVFQARITDSAGRSTTGIGESSRNNLGTRGRGNPVNMAQKRAYDRAVFDHLGIHGLLGEDELPDEEEVTTLMERIKTDEEKKAIAPLCNKIWAAKTKEELMTIREKVKLVEASYSPEQLNAIKGLWKKQLAILEKF